MPSPSPVGNKSEVLAQLDRMLNCPAFKSSKRNSGLFRYLVEKTLEGEAVHLKERVLGVEVFGRPADYDNSADPVVRVSAGEIRKRIAQYYHEPGHEKEIRIELPLGSYVPEFLEPTLSAEASPAAKGPVRSISLPPFLPEAKTRLRPAFLVSLALCVVVLAGVLTWWHPWVRTTPFEQFWRPFLGGATPVTICVGRRPVIEGVDPLPSIAWPNTVALAGFAALVKSAGGHYQLRRDDNITFEELSIGPAIILGRLNNVWGIRLTESLRFALQVDSGLHYIRDKNNPSSRAWSSPVAPQERITDFGLITRLIESQSGKPALIVTGVGGNGTDAATEFATNRAYFDMMAQKAPAGWERKNLQIVIETQVINGLSGPPTVAALHVW